MNYEKINNYVVKLLPTGLEVKPKEQSPEGVRALFYAIEKGNVVYAQKVLSMNFDPNLLHDNGYTPLSYAAMKGSAQMVETLLRNGVDPNARTKEGDTPVELALRFGHGDVGDLLKRARQEMETRSTPPAAESVAPHPPPSLPHLVRGGIPAPALPATGGYCIFIHAHSRPDH